MTAEIKVASGDVHMHPRKLRFTEDDSINDSPKRMRTRFDNCLSPPYGKVRALRLFDTPATPKTILQKCAANHLSRGAKSGSPSRSDRPQCLPVHNIMSKQTVNVNPFTPDSLNAQKKKRCRTQFKMESINFALEPLQITEDNMDVSFNANKILSDCDFEQAPKRLALQETNITRYNREFMQMSVIGVGEFGVVFQCVNRLDGCTYAVKKSRKPVAGSSFEKRALNEVWAHAVLGKHDNVVRYYSAWAEDDHMLIQNEYCNGGSLQEIITKHFLCENDLKLLLLHVAEGLRYIHSNGLVHMDIKPGNIFLTIEAPVKNMCEPLYLQNSKDDDMDDIYNELRESENIVTYKIGDLGHVTSAKEPWVEEGDCRYLAKEILEDDYSDLFKADIFSLGMTLYEAGGGGPLPKNGPEWHALRNGDIPNIPTLSKEFNELIKAMVDSRKERRPTLASIFSNPLLSSQDSKSRMQLCQELAAEKRKNEILLAQVCECRKLLKGQARSSKVTTENSNQGEERRVLRSFTRKSRTALISTSKFNNQSIASKVFTNINL